MSRAEHSPAYAVEVTSGAWNQLAQLSLETYQRVRNELDAAAARLMGMGKPTLELLKNVCQVTTLSLVVGQYVVLYDLNPERRLVTLREVARRLPKDG